MSGTAFSGGLSKSSTANHRNRLLRELVAEFVGTLMMVHIGTCVSAQSVLSRRDASSQMVVTFGWGLAVMFAVTMTYSVSGGLINPSVTLMTWAFGKLSLKNFVAYVTVQTAGAFCGAALTFVVYYAAIENFDGGVRSTYGVNSTAIVFIPFPSPYLGVISGIVDSILTSIIFILATAAIGDERNKLPSFLIPLYSGIIVMVMGSGYAMNAGSPVNPARDLGPRIFLLCAGYGWEVFGHNSWQWFWIPIVCPLIGSLIASSFYIFFTKFVQQPMGKHDSVSMIQMEEKM